MKFESTSAQGNQCIPWCSLLSMNQVSGTKCMLPETNKLSFIDRSWVQPFHYMLGHFAPVYDEYFPVIDDARFIIKSIKLRQAARNFSCTLFGTTIGLESYSSFSFGLQLIVGMKMSSVFKYL